jgi:SAM-dependent methyltransferase
MIGNESIEPAGLPPEMQQHAYPIMYKVEETHWWFVGRRRIIESFVREICFTMKRERPRILDVGCGTGANLEMLGKYGDSEGVDVSEDALEFCRARGLRNVRRGTLERLPYASDTFDLVTALDVLEHLDSDGDGLAEIHRVLNPGGYALLFVPAFMFLWGVQDDVSHHRRRYTLPGLKDVLRFAGFAIERATYANISFFAPILLGRSLMRIFGIRPASENNVNIMSLNTVLGRVLGAESFILRYINLPFGVSALCVARRMD